MLDLVPTRDGDRLDLVVSGELDLYTGPRLEQAVMVESATGATSVVLDLSGVTFVDSSGLSILIRLHQELAASGATLAVHNPSRFVTRLLDLTGIADSLTVTSD